MVALCLLIHVTIVFLLFDHVWAQVCPFDDTPFDGPFQVYNSLRRLDAGQSPGRDFVVFHGVGGPLVFYPYYKALGGDIVASEVSRLFWRGSQAVLVVLLFSWFFRLGWVGSILLWPLALGIQFRFYLLHHAGNSALEFRSMFPIIVAGMILAPRPVPLRAVWIGVVTALALLCAIEQGVAVVVAAVLSTCVAAFASIDKPKRWQLLRQTLAGLGLGVLLNFAVWYVLGGSAGVAACLTFYFIELPGDQFWFFGVPPNAMFDGEWLHHPRFCTVLIASPVGFCCSGIAYRRAATDTASRLALGQMTLFAYAGFASFAYLGLMNVGSVSASLRAIVAAVICGVISAWQARRARADVAGGGIRTAETAAERPRFWWRTAIFLLLAASPLVITPIVRATCDAGYSPDFEEHLATFSRVSGLAPEKPGNDTVWSTYAGAIEGHLNIFHPHTDYVIHVLGPERRASYLAKFEEVRPEYIVTDGPQFLYSWWLWQSYWDFYREVALNYEVVGRSRDMLTWRRKADDSDGPLDRDWVEAATTDGGKTYQIACPREPGKISLMEVKVAYRHHNSLGNIPLIGKLPRLFIYPSGTRVTEPVSLPPYETEFVFPAIPSEGDDIVLDYGTESITPGATLEIESVQARLVMQLDPDHPLASAPGDGGTQQPATRN